MESGDCKIHSILGIVCVEMYKTDFCLKLRRVCNPELSIEKLRIDCMIGLQRQVTSTPIMSKESPEIWFCIRSQVAKIIP